MKNSILEFLVNYNTFLGIQFQNWMIMLFAAFALWAIFTIVKKSN
jgi:hypothetical protein